MFQKKILKSRFKTFLKKIKKNILYNFKLKLKFISNVDSLGIKIFKKNKLSNIKSKLFKNLKYLVFN